MVINDTIAQPSRDDSAESLKIATLKSTAPAANPAPGAGKEQAKAPNQRAEPANDSNPEDAPPAEEKSARARLSLDPELHRVFVEIVDPDTGDVITRFPPEQIAEHIDSVLKQTDQETNLEDSGLIFDQSV